MNISEKLKKLRKEKNITQAQLADVLGLKRITVTQYESGRITPSSEMLLKISDYFGISIDEFVEQSVIDNNTKKLYGVMGSKEEKKSTYAEKIRSVTVQRLTEEFIKRTDDEFIKENRVLFDKLFDTLLRINVMAQKEGHQLISINPGAGTEDFQNIIYEFSRELYHLEKLSDMLK